MAVICKNSSLSINSRLLPVFCHTDYCGYKYQVLGWPTLECHVHQQVLSIWSQSLKNGHWRPKNLFILIISTMHRRTKLLSHISLLERGDISSLNYNYGPASVQQWNVCGFLKARLWTSPLRIKDGQRKDAQDVVPCGWMAITPSLAPSHTFLIILALTWKSPWFLLSANLDCHVLLCSLFCLFPW